VVDAVGDDNLIERLGLTPDARACSFEAAAEFDQARSFLPALTVGLSGGVILVGRLAHPFRRLRREGVWVDKPSKQLQSAVVRSVSKAL
jgi:hypothetical protein